MDYVSVTAAISIIAAGWAFFRIRARQQLAFIENFEFHPALRKKVSDRYPHLSESQLTMVFRGLRTYFLICNMAKRRIVAMPSQVVDVAWHEFILFTRTYQQFSRKALGRFLHHTPTEAMRSQTMAQEGIKRAWRLSCAKEQINPNTPNKLPLLFAIDNELGIEDGFRYVLNCQDKSHAGNNGSGDAYCAGHIACASGCSGSSGCAGDSVGSSCSGSSCSGGCGGGD